MCVNALHVPVKVGFKSFHYLLDSENKFYLRGFCDNPHAVTSAPESLAFEDRRPYTGVSPSQQMALQECNRRSIHPVLSWIPCNECNVSPLARFQVLTALLLKIKLRWDVTPCWWPNGCLSAVYPATMRHTGVDMNHLYTSLDTWRTAHYSAHLGFKPSRGFAIQSIPQSRMGFYFSATSSPKLDTGSRRSAQT